MQTVAARGLRTFEGAGRMLVLAGLTIVFAMTPLLFWSRLYDDFTLLKQASLLVAAALVLMGLAMRSDLLPGSRLTRIALAAWAACLALSFALGIDRWGSVLGYYQYRQGLLTNVAYLVLFLGGRSAVRAGGVRALLPAGLAGLAGTAFYTAVQAVNRDPIDWWLDTSRQAIGTIGNANELASYALICMALLGVTAHLRPRSRLAVTVAVPAAIGFVLLESASRSGVIALAIVVVSLAAFAVAGRDRRGDFGRLGQVAAGLSVGALLSLASGGFESTTNRVQAGFEASSTTRVELARGTLATVWKSPLTGNGPDALHLAFPRHRARLGGDFEQYDLVAQSSHNWALDVAANAGLPGLVSLAALVLSVVVASARDAARRTVQDAYIWSAMLGYVAMTMVNPLSLAAHAMFFVLLGVMLGRSELASALRNARDRRPVGGVVVAGGSAAALLAVAVLLPLADLRASQAYDAYIRGDFAQASRKYDEAARFMPLDRDYARRRAESRLAHAVPADREALLEALDAYEAYDRRFGFSSDDALQYATVLVGLGAPRSEIEPVLVRAEALNPEGVLIGPNLATLRQAAEFGGVLRYSPQLGRVVVDPEPDTASR